MFSQTSNAVNGITPDVAAAIAARQPLRSAAYAYDAHSATYYLSQRHYDPATMRFLTKDPARADGEESAYQYCAGDPVGKVDPTGLASVWVPIIKQGPHPWCWAASAVAVIRAVKGRSVSVEDFVRRVKGKLVDKGAYAWEVRKGLRAYDVWYNNIVGPLGLSSLDLQLKMKKPPIAMLSSGVNRHHMVVLYGVDTGKKTVSYMNPWGRKNTVSYETFRSGKSLGDGRRWIWTGTLAR